MSTDDGAGPRLSELLIIGLFDFPYRARPGEPYSEPNLIVRRVAGT